ncbi:MAG: hypothetical protein EXR61_06190 [Chloroflexi bacterium]|nr:hypothetical protein [Chloroflexota bacterium]
MKIIASALAVALLAALGAGSASGAGSAGVAGVAGSAGGAGSAGVSSVALAGTAGQGVAGAAKLESPAIPSGRARVAAELPATALTGKDNDADDEDDEDAKDAPKDKASKHHGALNRLRDVLALLVKAGTITAAQETAILDAAKDAFNKKRDAKPEQARAGEFHFTGAIFKVVREYLGVTQKDIAENAKAGKSLAELALAKGKTRDGLILAIVATVDKPTAATSAAVAKLVDAKGRLNAGRDNEEGKHGQNEKGKTNGRPTR